MDGNNSIISQTISTENPQATPPQQTQQTTPPATNPGGDVSSQGNDFLASIGDEKLRTNPLFANVKSVDELAALTATLQQKVDTPAVDVLTKESTPEQIDAWAKKNGVPEQPDAYQVEFKQGDAFGRPEDQGVFKQMAHTAKLTPFQAQTVADLYDKHINDTKAAVIADVQQKGMAEMVKLQTEFGDKTKPVMQRGVQALKIMGGDELAQMLENPLYGSHPGILRLIANMGKEYAETPMVRGGNVQMAGNSVPEIKEQIAQLMSRGTPYWDKKHPEHKATVERVLSLNKALAEANNAGK